MKRSALLRTMWCVAGIFLAGVLSDCGQGASGALQTAVQETPSAEPAPDDAAAPPPAAGKFSEPPGLVYFVGSVERVVGTSAVVDLGDVHSLKQGSVLTVFRGRDSQFRPLGTLTVANSHTTWMQSEPARQFVPEVGDVVLFIRTVGELGTGREIRDGFLANQRIANKDRNGYSTMRLDHVARSLMLLQSQQPKWVQYERRVAGVVQGDSLGETVSNGVQRLLNQIDLFRRLEEAGLPVSEAAGAEWSTVMSLLKGPPVKETPALTAKNAGNATPAAEPDSAIQIPVVEIQTMVARVLFDRSPEEQALASALSAALLFGEERNEPQWLRRELSHTQFPNLVNDEQFQLDILLVLRRLREKE